MSTSLLKVKGIGPAAAKLLVDHGIPCAEDLAKAKLGAVMAVQGFSEIRANRVIDAAKALLKGVAVGKEDKPVSAKSAAKKAEAQPKKAKKDKKEKKDKKKDKKKEKTSAKAVKEKKKKKAQKKSKKKK